MLRVFVQLLEGLWIETDRAGSLKISSELPIWNLSVSTCSREDYYKEAEEKAWIL